MRIALCLALLLFAATGIHAQEIAPVSASPMETEVQPLPDVVPAMEAPAEPSRTKVDVPADTEPAADAAQDRGRSWYFLAGALVVAIIVLAITL